MNATPLAQIKVRRDNKGLLKQQKLLYLHTDHLNTPRLATDPDQTVVWRWAGEAFGQTQPDRDPDGDGTKVNVRLRFPGQYHDGESGLYYNWNRYHDPKTGRYVTSDPIGLKGGPNPYTYAKNNSLRWIDPNGSQSLQEPQPPKVPPESEPKDYDPKDPQCEQKCFRQEFMECLIGGGVLCAGVCSAMLATTTPAGGAVCAVGCPCNAAYACYKLSEMFCKGACNKQ